MVLGSVLGAGSAALSLGHVALGVPVLYLWYWMWAVWRWVSSVCYAWVVLGMGCRLEC